MLSIPQITVRMLLHLYAYTPYYNEAPPMAKCGELTILFMVVAQDGETIRRDGQLHYFWIKISYAPIFRMQ